MCCIGVHTPSSSFADDREKEAAHRRVGGERETARETNEPRTVGARARAKGRRIGMRKLKRAVSPPSGERRGSSFVIPARLTRLGESTSAGARFTPRDRARRWSRGAVLNVISHVAAGCHERKVPQGHEFVAAAAAAVVADDLAEKVRSLKICALPRPPSRFFSVSRSRDRVGISIFARGRRRLIFWFNNRDVWLEREPSDAEREREKDIGGPRVRRIGAKGVLHGGYVRPRINARYIVLHVSLKTRVSAR